MNIRKALIVFLLSLNLSAVAGITTITEAYEVAVGDLRLPRNEGGTLAFKQCADCEPQTVRVTQRTRFVINGRGLELKDFKKSFSQIRNRADGIVIVLHHLESDTVTSVSMTL
jgi:hypothetical protein